MLYSVVLVSAVQQQEPAISIPPLRGPSSHSLPSHPSRLAQSAGLGSLCPIAASHYRFYTSIDALSCAVLLLASSLWLEGQLNLYVQGMLTVSLT